MTDAVSLPSSRAALVRLSSEIVSAYVIRNAVPVAQLPDLMASVHVALATLGRPAPAMVADPAKPSPAEIKRSIAPDGLISFLDGRRYKMLTRHLTRHGLTPAEYRTRFGLPKDYPMVTAIYAARRSELAKAVGLGTLRKRRDTAKSPSVADDLPSSSAAPTEAAAQHPGRARTKAKPVEVAPA